MDVLRVFMVILIISSCTRTSYLIEQAIGQAKILLNAKKNKEILEDKKIPEEYKDKIKKILNYKSFFYNYWNSKNTEIYTKTNILDRDVVSFLVIGSKPYEISPLITHFPFFGGFPYLGFFNKKSALEYSKKLQEDGYETYVRGVDAYSTLGKLDDPILSTFFKYGEVQLAELIFHELFHTFLFIENEVDLNENLANFIGKQMVYEYFSKGNKKIKEYYIKQAQYKKLNLKISILGEKLKKILKLKKWEEEKKKFLAGEFKSDILKYCKKNQIKTCWPLSFEWNTATFAAFMTYEKNQNSIEKKLKNFKNIKDFVLFIRNEYNKYKKNKGLTSFEDYLFKKEG